MSAPDSGIHLGFDVVELDDGDLEALLREGGDANGFYTLKSKPVASRWVFVCVFVGVYGGRVMDLLGVNWRLPIVFGVCLRSNGCCQGKLIGAVLYLRCIGVECFVGDKDLWVNWRLIGVNKGLFRVYWVLFGECWRCQG